MNKDEKRKYIKLLKLIGKDFLLLTPKHRMLMVKTAGIIKLPWIGRPYTRKDFK